jgi:hypothetical protein
VNQSRGIIVGNEIYFELGWRGDAILYYDFVKHHHHLSVIDTPDSYKRNIVLMLTHDGFLGLSSTHRVFGWGATGAERSRPSFSGWLQPFSCWLKMLGWSGSDPLFLFG